MQKLDVRGRDSVQEAHRPSISGLTSLFDHWPTPFTGSEITKYAVELHRDEGLGPETAGPVLTVCTGREEQIPREEERDTLRGMTQSACMLVIWRRFPPDCKVKYAVASSQQDVLCDMRMRIQREKSGRESEMKVGVYTTAARHPTPDRASTSSATRCLRGKKETNTYLTSC